MDALGIGDEVVVGEGVVRVVDVLRRALLRRSEDDDGPSARGRTLTMEIGEPQRVYTVEPVEAPVRHEVPEEQPEREPARGPAEPVPAP